MSDIVGFINLDKAPDSLLNDMVESIQYSKSDFIDKWSDNFIKIARVYHGIINSKDQPIFNENKSLCIMMAGEIFDYESEKQYLIRKGHNFILENNDAEYCLHLYETLGEEAFGKLNGSFLIVLYDLKSHKLLIVNDRFASYPLFYYSNKGRLIFGTKVHPLLKFDKLPRILNLQAVFEFFTFTRILGTKTYFKDISVLPPATILHCINKSISFAPYWEMKYKVEKHPERYYVKELAKTLKKSVERRTQENHRFGILLSGGLDSRMVLAASDKKMVAFTIGDDGDNEVEIARKIAEAKGCKHILLKPNRDHFVNLFDKAVEIGDGMYCFRHAWATGFMDQIRENCDILLHGNPPELFFRGTSLPRGKKLKIFGRRIRDIPILWKLSKDTLEDTIKKKLKYGIYQQNPKQLFVKSYSSIFDKVLSNSIRSILAKTDKKVTNIYDKFLLFDIYYTSRYPSFLMEISFRTFIDEQTVLLFDNDLLDLHLRMPIKMRSNNRAWNKAIAKLDPKIASISDANTGYSLFIHEILVWILSSVRDVFALIKRHFIKPSCSTYSVYTLSTWANYSEMIRHNNQLRRLIQDTIENQECLDPLFFNIQKINEMYKEHLSGKKNYAEILFLLLTFGRWYKKYGSHTKLYVGG